MHAQRQRSTFLTVALVMLGALFVAVVAVVAAVVAPLLFIIGLPIALRNATRST